MHGTNAGLPSGIPGIADEMDGMMQHAPHPATVTVPPFTWTAFVDAADPPVAVPVQVDPPMPSKNVSQFALTSKVPPVGISRLALLPADELNCIAVTTALA